MPARWTTNEQVKFLEKYVSLFCASQVAGTVSSEFMPMINCEWFAVYPIPEDDPDYAHKHAKQCDAPGENDLIQLIRKDNQKKKALTAVQVFSKLYYDTHVKPLVDAELDALRKASPTGKLEKGAHLAIVKRITKKAWESVSDEVKEQRLKSKAKQEKKNEDEAIETLMHQIPDLIEHVGKQLLTLGWTGMFMGGLDHKTSQLKTHFYDAGVNCVGLSFAESLPNHKNTLTGPFSAFVRDFYHATTKKTAEGAEPICKSVVVVKKKSSLQASKPMGQPASEKPEEAKSKKKGCTPGSTVPQIAQSPSAVPIIHGPGAPVITPVIAPVTATASPIVSPGPIPVAPVIEGPGTVPVAPGAPAAVPTIQATDPVINPQLTHLSPYTLSPSGIPMSFGPLELIPAMANAASADGHAASPKEGAASSKCKCGPAAGGTSGKRKHGQAELHEEGEKGNKTQTKKCKTIPKAASDSQVEKENIPPAVEAEDTTGACRSNCTCTTPKDSRNLIGGPGK
ncbi:hypothetical protein VKT23_013873 [Stygiomarasmius scandens]|uniref:Uncharacterized protein n=1 Tax=Marasmiellus scandens TaxID=2682957 RepID=A0ABR1J4P9_9AGAR